MTALEINDLRFRYDGAADWTVNIPHLRLERGEQMLLTGSSGRGKSTLLHLIAGLVDPTKAASSSTARAWAHCTAIAATCSAARASA